MRVREEGLGVCVGVGCGGRVLRETEAVRWMGFVCSLLPLK